jgi:triosephosphate isomerase
MHGSINSVQQLLLEIKTKTVVKNLAEMAVCSPAIFIPQIQTLLQGTNIAWGGQDLSIYASGAYTGEISGNMLKEFGCKYVIIGHSERRSYHNESNELVAKKCAAALQVELIPIVCVGETLEQREQGITENIVGTQLDALIQCNGIRSLERSVIAYEPIWAIGTGRTATPDQAQEVHAFIRKRIAAHDTNVAQTIKILYGGSMKADNAQELLAKPDIDGGLIGGASLKAIEFLAIYAQAG